MISQAMLRAYAEVEQELAAYYALLARREELRQRLLAALWQGAQVERGELTMKIEYTWERRLTAEPLGNLLGPDFGGGIRKAVPRSPVLHLKVYRSVPE